MEQELQSLETEARKSLQSLDDKSLLEDFRIRYLGRKGKFSTIMRQLGTVAAEDRPRVGQLANSIKAEIEKLFEEKQQTLNASPDAAEIPRRTRSYPAWTLPCTRQTASDQPGDARDLCNLRKSRIFRS